MKSSHILLLISAALAGFIKAEETPVPEGKFRAGRTELIWPEINNPEALIALSGTEISALRATDRQQKDLDIRNEKLLAGLHPYYVTVTRDFVCIALNTSPFTGQAVVISTDPTIITGRYKEWWAKIVDTKWPEIKLVLLKAGGGINPVSSSFDEYYVRWRRLKLLEPVKSTVPMPVVTTTPGYPYEMMNAGILGTVQLEFTVTVDGLVSDLNVKASHSEFEKPVREAISQWRFEPGVDLQTRLPVAARASMSIDFLTE